MVYWDQIRKTGGLPDIVKSMIEEQQRRSSDSAIEDVGQFWQSRLDEDPLKYTDTYERPPHPEETDPLAYTDEHEQRLVTGGTFKIAEGKDVMKANLFIEHGGLSDLSGNLNNTTLFGSAELKSPKGPFGRAIYIPDNSSYADLTSAISMDVNSVHVLMSAWIYPFNQAHDPTFASWSIIDINGAQMGIGIGNNGSLRLWSNGNANTLAGGSVTFEAWNQIGIIYTAGSASRKGYVNGAHVATDPSAGGIPNQNTIPRLGRLGGGYTANAYGYIADAKILVRASSAFVDADMANLYNTVIFGGGSIYDPPLCINFGDVGV